MKALLLAAILLLALAPAGHATYGYYGQDFEWHEINANDPEWTEVLCQAHDGLASKETTNPRVENIGGKNVYVYDMIVKCNNGTTFIIKQIGPPIEWQSAFMADIPADPPPDTNCYDGHYDDEGWNPPTC